MPNRRNVVWWMALILLLGALLWFVPQLQGKYFSQDVAPKEVPVLVNEYRRTLAQIIGGFGLLLGLYFTWRTLQVNREGQITERFTRAVDQLGAGEGENKSLEIRLGGIYALERISRESERDYWPIMEILSAYVREHAPRDSGAALENYVSTRTGHADADIQAIISVIGRRTRAWGKGEDARIRLDNTDLRSTSFWHTNLTGVWFGEADLRRSHFGRADLREASFQRADLREAFFDQVKNLQGTEFTDANLERTSFKGVNLEGVTGLTQLQIDQAYGDENTKLPADLHMPESWRSSSTDQANGG